MAFTAYGDALRKCVGAGNSGVRRWRAAGLAWVVLALLLVPAASAGAPTPAPRASAASARAAGTPIPGGVTGQPQWRWPLDGTPQVLRPFDPPANPYGPGHRGVDLASTPGATVRAAGGGTVWFAGQVGGRGVVSIRHPDGRRTTYEPLHVGVRVGAAVQPGAPLGQLAIGHPGCPITACLHWGLISGTNYENPLSLLSPGHVRLYAG